MWIPSTILDSTAREKVNYVLRLDVCAAYTNSEISIMSGYGTRKHQKLLN